MKYAIVLFLVVVVAAAILRAKSKHNSARVSDTPGGPKRSPQKPPEEQ